MIVNTIRFTALAFLFGLVVCSTCPAVVWAQSWKDTRVAPGSDAGARAYYNRIEKVLGAVFTNDDSPVPPPSTDATTLDGLLVYLGYQKKSVGGLLAANLEEIESYGL